ncbi:MAG TPA: hypothetical protein VIT91_00240 [Chthoniobacterales bacterium]
MKDDLNDLLRTWNPHVPEPDGFRRGVWRRIGLSATNAQPSGWLEKFLIFVAKPHIAAAAVAVAILAGGVTGFVLTNANGEENYLRSVNPYAQVR